MRTPKLHDEVPALRWMFPSQYERDWVRFVCSVVHVSVFFLHV